jgi:hypothetical protein
MGYSPLLRVAFWNCILISTNEKEFEEQWAFFDVCDLTTKTKG